MGDMAMPTAVPPAAEPLEDSATEHREPGRARQGGPSVDRANTGGPKQPGKGPGRQESDAAEETPPPSGDLGTAGTVKGLTHRAARDAPRG